MNDWRLFGIGLLYVLCMATALGAVYSKHYSRKLYMQLESLQQVRDDLNVDWGRLELEQSTWATHQRIEEVARDKLHMFLPTGGAIIIVPP